ncbi:MAG: hypothetical protein JW913_11845 [Chitinispirillaceae bacterium]|nr:hypothetical protein [Chitinispirillaceae bacterium]
MEWESVGTGVNQPVTLLAIHDSLLYMVGKFTVAGDKASPNIAALNIHTVNTAKIWNRSTEKIPALPVGFRIFQSVLEIDKLQHNDHVSLYTLSGRCVRKVTGRSKVSLSGLASQPLVVEIYRTDKRISTDKIMIH